MTAGWWAVTGGFAALFVTFVACAALRAGSDADDVCGYDDRDDE